MCMYYLTNKHSRKPHSDAKKTLVFAACIAGPIAAGISVFLLSGSMPNAGGTIEFPPFSPPIWLFGAIWPVLYALMGLALYRVYSRRNVLHSAKRDAYALFSVQLALNLLWTFLFFGLRIYWLAGLVFIALCVVLGIMMPVFHMVDTRTSAILMPYFIWLLYCTYVNVGVVVLN